jgi:transposase
MTREEKQEQMKIRDAQICADYLAGADPKELRIKYKLNLATIYEVLNREGAREYKPSARPDLTTYTVEFDETIDYRKKKNIPLRNQIMYDLRVIDKRPIKEVAKMFGVHISVVSRGVQKAATLRGDK